MENVAAILFALSAGQYPDALDHLRAGDVIPQVGLLLDRSGSMDWGPIATDCDWFANTYNGGNSVLNKNKQMHAALVGCRAATDGILDLWASRVNFSIYEFGSATALRVPFGATLAQLEGGTLLIPASGSTYMSLGIRDHGRYFRDHFTGNNSLDCRPNFLLMLSDGNPNGGSATFDYECSSSPLVRSVSASQPWMGSDYLHDAQDILCSVPGDQNIRTYTIGFGEPGDFSPTNLQNIASRGGGEYFYASDREALSEAFENIISAIVAKSAIFFAPIAIQSDSLFADNYAFTAAFKPEAAGPWRGTVKKYCVVPPLRSDGSYDPTIDTCLFRSNDGRDLETNPDAADLWTGTRNLAADVGGAGEVIYELLGTTPGGPPVAPYWDHRTILTWRPGGTEYVAVRPDTWDSNDAWANGCEHARLINYLHGYTYDADCGTGAPIAARRWILGDAVHFAPVLLKYARCHDPTGQPVPGACFLVAGMNDGMVHFFDAATGQETSALIPGDLWKPEQASTSIIAELQAQPNLSFTHRFYVDGDARLFHDDQNGDGLIQPAEAAHVVFGLGRGGRAYYQLPVSTLTNGVLSTAHNPIRPLVATAGTSFAELVDTWAAPWLGRGRFAGAVKNVAVVPSGHIAALDVVEAPSEVAAAEPPPPTQVDLNLKKSVNCDPYATFNGLTSNSFCSKWYRDACQATGASPCYDAARVPLDDTTQPVTFNDGIFRAAAQRFYFDRFDLQSADSLRVEDDQGNLIGSYSGTSLASKWTPWVYGEHVVLRFLTNGVESRDRGWRISRMEWVPGDLLYPPTAGGEPPGPAPLTDFELGVDHHPTVFVLDLARWNGVSPQPFAGVATDDGVLLRITNDCNGLTDRCLDRSTDPDLEHMICPISAEVSGFSSGKYLDALYWGDECGQIWKAWTDDGGDHWRARRVINLNGGHIRHWKDHRKILRRLDLVSTTCPGRRAVGIYFGTGNGQRPAAKDELEDPAITNGRDLIGVVWDFVGAPSNATESDLVDASAAMVSAPAEVASGRLGWYIALADNERMLRDPLVFDRVAYFKTYEPTQEAVECGGGSGIDRIYALNACTAGAANDLNNNGSRTLSEREVWAGETEIGGGLFFFTPKDSPVLVSHADLSQRQKAALNQRSRSRPGLFLWREL